MRKSTGSYPSLTVDTTAEKGRGPCRCGAADRGRRWRRSRFGPPRSMRGSTGLFTSARDDDTRAACGHLNSCVVRP
jgi:hypothetical protein